MSLWQKLTWAFRPGARKPLSARQPARQADAAVPLGMEATDMSIVNEVNRRNNALERVSALAPSRRHFGSFLENAQTGVAPLADDETYAAHYHRAYIEKKESHKDV